jgi:hypothetical protein
MYIADIVLKLIRFILQKLAYPVMLHDIPILSYDFLVSHLLALEHNFAWALAGLDKFFNLELLFSILLIMVSAEVMFWLFRAIKWIIELVRG